MPMAAPAATSDTKWTPSATLETAISTATTPYSNANGGTNTETTTMVNTAWSV